MLKKFLSLFLSSVLVLSLTACGKNINQNSNVSDIAEKSSSAPASIGTKKLSIVTTIFPPYDFARQVAGEKADIKMLLPPASESHSFEPTPQDIIDISNADIFIYAGGDSDTWVNGILESIDTSKIKILSMMGLVDVVEEEIKEGMTEDDHDHHHEHDKKLTEEDVHDRALSDWSGEWKSIESALENGSLDEYVKHSAEENETDTEAQKNELTKKWKSDYDSITISDNTVNFDGIETDYKYIGYKIIDSDHGSSVWYGFETQNENVPKYIAFNDHGTSHAEDEHNHEEHDHEHDEQETPHFYLRYGNESFEKLTTIEDWTPKYFTKEASDEDIAKAMNEHNHGHSHEGVYDEHVWTSPVNAKLITQAIAKAMIEKDSVNTDTYQKNETKYIAELDALDKSFRDVVANAKRKTLIFGDRFPFRYFVEEYGLDYYAAFPGCSTETEANAQTIAFLIDKVKAEEIPVVFHIELSNEKMADTICNETNAKKALFHSAHNLTKDEFNNGTTYLDVMKKNVESLKEALQ